jgi:hypothetical protein
VENQVDIEIERAQVEDTFPEIDAFSYPLGENGILAE